ncbi:MULTISPECIES: LPXTG cell wall anchor domain-containing protein [unclassified Adlercreutzia]|uniref:LPXTG cell wall anchor domain-containing protein n=1 Tax=unclassified Adlercreutzia TaxID=2636013 RepID=UPI0013EC9DC1|nr:MULTISPECIES: LPXTG cell wall anchor domain-containing protein [unclassified Adlercreutzia]
MGMRREKGACGAARAAAGARAGMFFLAAALALCAACVTAALPTGAAFAVEYNGRTDWSVTFTPDEKMVHAPENMNFADAVSDMQPGDVNTVAVTIKNDHAATTDWYLANEVIRSLEASVSVAHGGGYGYVLTYKGPSGQEKALFGSDQVGGESVGSSGEGLHEATSSLEGFLMLDTLKSGEQGLVTLQVSLDGETNNNAYQDTLADIKMRFAVELAATPGQPGTSGTPGSPSVSPGSSGSGGPSGSMLPQTGDRTNTILLLTLAGASGVVLLVLALFGRRWRREQETAGKEGEHARR